MNHSRIAALLVFTATGIGCASDTDTEEYQVSDDPEVRAAAATITEDDYLRRISVIAHDSMMGRDTPSEELNETARWIAGEFESFGLEPGGDDGGYLQHYEIQTVRADLDASSIQVSGAGELQLGRDVVPTFGRVTGGDFTGPLTVVSGTDGDVDSLADRIADHHVVYVTSEDAGRAVFNVARALRTAGALSVTTVSRANEDDWAEVVEQAASRTSVRIGSREGSRMPFFTARPSAMESLLAANGATLPAPAEELAVTEVPGLELTYSPRVEVVRSDQAPNVVGILPGSDPELSDEYLVYSAHMDHVGTGEPDASGDSIWNGADDDASGTTAVIEIAEAFAGLETPPRRSVVFLLVSGEEKGLWGSAYFAEDPTVPGEGIVANLNADMVGRNWNDTIVVIGKEHSDLGETMNRVNEAHPELNMTAIDDIWPEERFYFRSDHFNFARRGVPVLFFFNGTHDDYHGRDDEVEKIGVDKAARISQLMFYLGWEIAERTEPPRWDPESRDEIVTDSF